MTDEEKAEEYAENEQCAHCSNPQYCQGKDECYDFANTKSHFLAGLAAEDSFKCKKVLYKWETDKHSYIDGFRDGAQFGYNKCKEELNQNVLALQSDMDKTIEQNIALKKELNKANEWHFVKDELPDAGTYLVVWQNDKGYKEIFILYYEEDDEEELHWVDDDCEVQDEYVIAWKEIVFPKEIKEK